MRESAEHDMRHRGDLLLRGCDQLRVRVAVASGPPAAHAVDEGAAVGEVEVHALGGLDQLGRNRRRDGAVWVPDVVGVELGEVGDGWLGMWLGVRLGVLRGGRLGGFRGCHDTQA